MANSRRRQSIITQIGMVGWLYCFVKNPDPADHKAISNPEYGLLDPQSKELFQGDPPHPPRLGKLPFFLSWLSPYSLRSLGGNSCPSWLESNSPTNKQVLVDQSQERLDPPCRFFLWATSSASCLPQGPPSESLFGFQLVMIVHQDLIAGWPVQKLKYQKGSISFLF